jgi:hypothetical protein
MEGTSYHPRPHKREFQMSNDVKIWMLKEGLPFYSKTGCSLVD